MLQYIRERATGWFAWTIIGLIIIPFALWGINSYFEGGGDAVVANVNGTDISLREYQDRMSQQRERVRSMLGANARADLIESLVKPQDVLDIVIEQETLVQAAVDAGYRVNDSVIADQIRSIEAFQRDGQFSKQMFEQALKSRGMSAKALEMDLTRGVFLDQLNSGVVATAIVTKSETDNYLRLRDQKREIGYMIIPSAPVEATITPTEEQIKAYYDEQKARFVQPEEVSIEYVELLAPEIATRMTASEDEIKEHYEANKSQFGVGEERRARHILLTFDAKTDPNGDKAKSEAQQLIDRINKGESFESLAKQYSRDPGSASSGGDLGYFGRGTMDAAFETATFALTKGAVSAPVKSAFGYHVIKLEDIRPGTIKPLNEVRAEIERQVKDKKSQAEFADRIDTMTNLAYEKPDGLQPITDALGLRIQQSALFSRRGGAGLTANPKVAEAAFSEDVLKKGLNSEPIEISPNQVIVLRVKEHKPEQQRTLDEVRAQVVAAVKRELATKKVQESGQAAVKRIESGEDPAKIAKELNAEWKAPVTIGRNDAAVDRKIATESFKMPRPEAGKALVRGADMGNGNFVVIRLASVKDGDPASIDETQLAGVKQTLTNNNAEAEYGAMLENMKSKADIARFEDKL